MTNPFRSSLAARRYASGRPDVHREFARRIGVTKADNSIEMGVLESCIREDLDANAERRMAVMRPVKVVITNWPEGESEELAAPNHPKDETRGSRRIRMSREIFIDREDFREQANRKYKRLVLGDEVRLRNSYVIRADEVVKGDDGEIVELRCSYDPATLGVNPPDRKVRGVIHWVSAEFGVQAEVRLYDRLFNHPAPDADKEIEDWKQHLNPESLVVIDHAWVEPLLAEAEPGERFQFEREGYFSRDPEISDRLVFNRVVTLRDSWAKIEQKG